MTDCLKKIEAPPKKYKFTFNITSMAAITIILLSLLLGVFLIRVSSLFQCKCMTDLADQDLKRVIPANATIGSEISDENILHLVLRDEWLAQPSSEPLDKLVLPVHRVIISHTATENCATQATCKFRVRIIQSFHMKLRDFSDIAYNFLVGGDGYVYEGRGWDQQGAHTKGYNVDSVGIAFIGTFQAVKPSEKQLHAAKLIIEEGVRLNKLVKDYQLYSARQLGRSDSTGSALYNEIKNWPNWSPSL